MTKRLHPIRKMRQALGNAIFQETLPENQAQEERIITRHVKPLLNALEEEHNGHHIDALYCRPCRLLAEWRAKLND